MQLDRFSHGVAKDAGTINPPYQNINSLKIHFIDIQQNIFPSGNDIQDDTSDTLNAHA